MNESANALDHQMLLNKCDTIYISWFGNVVTSLTSTFLSILSSFVHTQKWCKELWKIKQIITKGETKEANNVIVMM